MRRLLIILAGLLNTYAYVQMVLPQCAGLCIRVHRDIIAGIELAPYRYRVLVPLLTQPFIGADEASFTIAYIGFHLIAFVTMMLVLHAWLRA